MNDLGELLPALIGGVIGLAILLIPTIFYLLTLQSTLQKIHPKNRLMNPGEVWLMLIPLFGTIWRFIIVNRVADSLKAEFHSRGIKVNEVRPTFEIGLAYAILRACFIIPILNYLAIVGAFICWIIYWVKVNEYREKLMRSAKDPMFHKPEAVTFDAPPKLEDGVSEEDFFKD